MVPRRTLPNMGHSRTPLELAGASTVQVPAVLVVGGVVQVPSAFQLRQLGVYFD